MASAATAPALPPPSVAIDTSEAAADAIASHTVRLRRQVLAAIVAARDGATADELEQSTGLDGNTLRPRLWELEYAMQHIRKSDVKRRTRRGRPARAYVATVAGLRAFASAVHRETE